MSETEQDALIDRIERRRRWRSLRVRLLALAAIVATAAAGVWLVMAL